MEAATQYLLHYGQSFSHAYPIILSFANEYRFRRKPFNIQTKGNPVVQETDFIITGEPYKDYLKIGEQSQSEGCDVKGVGCEIQNVPHIVNVFKCAFVPQLFNFCPY